MKSFTEYLDENHPINEGWAKNLAIGAALAGAGMGGMNMLSKPHSDDRASVNQSVTSDDASNFLGSNQHWNSQIGSFTPVNYKGKTVLKAKDGTLYVPVRNIFGQMKYKIVDF